MARHGDEVAEVARWAEGIERVHECPPSRFRRPEPRRRALEYLRGLLSPVERKNGWQLAEQPFGTAQEGMSPSAVHIEWVVSDEWQANASDFRVSANIGEILAAHGAGVYEVAIWGKINGEPAMIAKHPIFYQVAVATGYGAE